MIHEPTRTSAYVVEGVRSPLLEPEPTFSPVPLIICARVMLEEAIDAPATPVCPFLIEVARSRLAERMANTSTLTLTQRLRRECK